MKEIWDNHYRRERAMQQYPDENVVRVFKYVERKSGSMALDLGSGSGRHLSLMKDHFDRVIPTDFSRESLRSSHGVQSALPNLPFADRIFDFILCWGVLHYLPLGEIPAAVSEIRRILKPGGHVFLTLRSDQDTHLAAQLKAGDLKDGKAELFSKSATLKLVQNFDSVRYGFISRQPLGDEHLVAHHMILASV